MEKRICPGCNQPVYSADTFNSLICVHCKTEILQGNYTQDITAVMIQELDKANKKYPLFSSAHEGYGVMAEEFQELFEEIRKKEPDKQRMYEEAIQLGAMCIK